MNRRGFTLLEVMLSVAVIGVLAGVSMPLYASFVNRNDLDLAAQHVAETLRRAQVYARGMNGDSAWSVRIQTTDIRLYKGTNFGGRDTAFDEAVTLPGSATASGLTDVQFAKLSAAPNTSGDITLTGANNETRTVSINAKGAVDY